MPQCKEKQSVPLKRGRMREKAITHFMHSVCLLRWSIVRRLSSPQWQCYGLLRVRPSTFGGTLKECRRSWHARFHKFSSSFSPCPITSPIGLVKDAARPAYWVPDHEILHCHNCRKEFSIKLSKHHCRACGQGFCDECSHDRRAVPSRGWDHPVRVCFNCNKKPGDL